MIYIKLFILGQSFYQVTVQVINNGESWIKLHFDDQNKINKKNLNIKTK